MPTTYGNTAFADARAVVIAELDALKADMVTNAVSPRFDAVYDTHWETPALDYYCVSVGVEGVTDQTMSPNRIEYLYQVELRIMTSDDNKNFDEQVFYNLANSILNWFRVYGQSMSNNFRFKTSVPARVEPNVTFSDTRSIGGRVQFTIFGVEIYTPA